MVGVTLILISIATLLYLFRHIDLQWLRPAAGSLRRNRSPTTVNSPAMDRANIKTVDQLLTPLCLHGQRGVSGDQLEQNSCMTIL